MESKIKEFSQDIAKEISERSIMDIDAVAMMIETRIKASMLDFVNEYSTKEETQYLRLLNIQSQQRVGSKEYNEVAYKLTAAKARKAAANRAANCLKREDTYDKFKSWVAARHGKDEVDLFISETASV